MGKYIKKEKASSAGDLSPIELTQPSLGVRTRAKTLALQRLQKSPAFANPPSGDGSYLQLRSRTLVKSPAVVAGDSKRQKQGSKGGGGGANPNSRTGSRLKVNTVNSGPDGLCSPAKKDENRVEKETAGGEKGDGNCGNDMDAGIEASFGENVLEFEGRERTRVSVLSAALMDKDDHLLKLNVCSSETQASVQMENVHDFRSTRENTPCSFIKDPDSVRTPGSTTKPSSSSEANRQVHNSIRRNIPTSRDMDEFFSGPEKQQQEQFIEKYNFDPVNEKPLPGRFEWVKLNNV